MALPATKRIQVQAAKDVEISTQTGGHPWLAKDDMAWRLNQFGGVYKRGSSYPMQKHYQILGSYLESGSLAEAAVANMCTYDTAKSVTLKFLNTGSFEPGNRGSPSTMMDPWKVAYLESLVCHDPSMYLSEMQQALRDDLQLELFEVPSIPTICKTLQDLDLTRHKASKVPLERFTEVNIATRTPFVKWRRTVDPRRLYFVDETAVQLADGVRQIWRDHTNHKLPLIANRADAREKMSVLSVVGYDAGVLDAYPIYGSFNRIQFNDGMKQHFVHLIP